LVPCFDPHTAPIPMEAALTRPEFVQTSELLKARQALFWSIRLTIKTGAAI